MAWPTDIKIQPQVYDQLFTTHWEELLEALDSKGIGKNKDYQLGDFADALHNCPKALKDLDIDRGDIDEWLQVLSDHFQDKPDDRRFIERIFNIALRSRRKIEMTVTDSARWLTPLADHEEVDQPVRVHIHSRRVPRKRP